VRPTLVVVDDIAEMVAAAVMRFAHTHRVMREVDIAVVAWKVSKCELELSCRWSWVCA
jgi:hypothetical protein